MKTKDKAILSILLFFGSLSWSLPMIKSGLIYSFGMGFWGPNGHDGVWHIALIESLSRFDFSLPIMAGEVLTNYHFGFDLLLAIIHRISNIPPVTLYFQIVPPILAVAVGLLTYKLVITITKSKLQAWWSTFFVYFGGSFGWLVGLLKDGKFGGESMFWANQSVSTLINPPYALSLIVLLAGLVCLYDYFQKPNTKRLLLTSLLFGSLFIIKIYAGVIVSFSLMLLWITTSIRRRIRVKELTLLLFCTGVISLLLFLPFNHLSTSLLVFSPLWFPHTMLSFSDRLGWFKLEQARLAYFQSHLWFKWALAEGLALSIFIVGNLGTRIIGFYSIKQVWHKDYVGKLLLIGLSVSIVIPLLFIQKGNPWNTIQFFYYTQFFLAILAGLTIGGILESNKTKNIIKIIVVVVAIAMTIPTTWITLKDNYLPPRPPSRISNEELEALDFLKRQPKGVVLSYPFDPQWRQSVTEPRPLYAYETTAYISALSGQPSFLADEMNLTITGYQYDQRRIHSTKLFTTTEADWAKQFIKDNQIRYVYLVKGQKLNLGTGDINGIKVFENGEVVIYQVE